MLTRRGTHVRRVVCLLLCSTLVCAVFAPLGAQVVADSGQQGPGERLFVKRDAWIALGFTGLTIAMFPLDRSAALRLQREKIQSRLLYVRSATTFRLLGAEISLATAGAMYAAGRLADDRRLAGAGLHIAESMVLGSTITVIGKGLAGRARPRHFKDTLGLQPFDPNPRDFQFGRGWGEGQFQSFPSGHTTSAFAFASALVSESHAWRPQWTWWVAPVFYGGASLVGFSRMYNNAHWASDVALGAAIGTFAGLKVVKFNRHNPSNKVDRFFLGRSDAASARMSAPLIRWSYQF